MNKTFSILVLIFSLAACDQGIDEDLSPWKYEQPQNLGANAGLLLKMDQDINAEKFGKVRNVLIIKDDNVIFENYYNGYKRTDLNPLNRASQSILALVLQSALDDASLSYSDKIIDLFPEHEDIFYNIPQKDKIEIKHLLEQTSGFNWDEWNFTRLAQNNRAEEMRQSDDWVKFALSTRMIREPGMEFNFNSGHSIIMSAILEKNLPGTLKDYMFDNLFKPLGIKNYHWEENSGVLNTSSGLELTASDMGKIGYMLLKDGKWGGTDVVSEEWIQNMIRPIAASDYYRAGTSWFRFNAFHPVVKSLRTNDLFFSWGEGGQFIFIAPHLDMVVVITADNYVTGQEFQQFYILRDYILPAVISDLDQPIPFFN